MIRLEAHHWRVGVDPESGGGLTHLSYQGLPVFRDRDSGASGFPPLQMSCFPLVPFSNRIAGAHFSFRGQQVHLPHNMPGEGHSIHGFGWTSKWDVVDLTDHVCSLAFRHEPGDWPWRFHVVQNIRLSPAGVIMDLRLTNEASNVMPAGLGFHPYFHASEACELEFPAQRVWTGLEAGIPDKAVAVPEEWDFREMRPVTGLAVDHCFSGWDGRARIFWPNAGLEVEMTCSPNARHATLYAPNESRPGAGFFCLEPVTHVSNALNFPSPEEAGILALKPGETVSLVMSLRATSRDPQAER